MRQRSIHRLFVIMLVLAAQFAYWTWRNTEAFHPPYTFEKWASAFWEFSPMILFMGAAFVAIWWYSGDRKAG